MPPYAVQPAVLRVIAVPGHGWSNTIPGRYDSGATSDCTDLDEATIARNVIDRAMDLDAPPKTIILRNDDCDSACLRLHKAFSHLTYTVLHWNRHRTPQDFILALHLDAADNERASGVSVYIANDAPFARRKQAEVLARVISEKLGLPNRGVYKSSESQHSRLAILDDTQAPAALIEIGYITNPQDVAAITNCGHEAFMAGIGALRGHIQ